MTCYKYCLNFLIGLLLYTRRIYGQVAINVPAVGNYGEETHMNCTEANFDITKGYTWLKDNLIIYDNINGDATSTGKYLSSHGTGIFTLTITKTDLDDAGVYVCNYDFDQQSGTLEIQSRGTVTAKFISTKHLEVSFGEIYPNSTAVVITCGTNVAGEFVSSVEKGGRFTNTWKSHETYSSLPTSCSASVTLRTMFNTTFNVTSVIIVAVIVGLLWWHISLIVIGSYLLGFFGIGVVVGLIVRKTTCCCACFYKGESCEDCVSNNCECKCCYETPCGACFNIKELPSWYKILWLSIIGSPVAFGMWVAMKCCGLGKGDRASNVVNTGSHPEERQRLGRPQPPLPNSNHREGSGSVVSGRDVEMQETDTSLRRSHDRNVHHPANIVIPTRRAGALEPISAREEV